MLESGWIQSYHLQGAFQRSKEDQEEENNWLKEGVEESFLSQEENKEDAKKENEKVESGEEPMEQ